MTTEMKMRDAMGPDEFDVLLNDVLRTVANPEIPERVQVRTRVWVRKMARRTSLRDARPANQQVGDSGRPAAVFAPEVFLAQMSGGRDARTTWAALALHAAAILLVLWVGAARLHMLAPAAKSPEISVIMPPPMEQKKDAMGGGGGQHEPTPVTKGHLPKFDRQITPPKAPVEARIPMPEPSIEVQKDLKMADNNLPNIGLPTSTLMGNSMGNGRGSGLGAGNGSGLGPGSGGNYGGGLMKIGGGVSAPVLIYKVDPEFSEEARKARFQGNVLVTLVVDPQGLPRNIRVLQGAGMGLDERAVEAVKQYRFRPAMENGKPVAVQMNVDVEFQIF